MSNLLTIDNSSEEYAIDKLDPSTPSGLDVMRNLWNKEIQIYNDRSSFWQPRLDMGKKCQRFKRAKIFNKKAIDKYKDTDKIPVQPQIFKPIINQMTNMIFGSARSGAIVMEDSTPPQNAANPDIVNTVLKWWENYLKLQPKKRRLLDEGLTTGYPGWIIFSRDKNINSKYGGIKADWIPWDSTLCSPWFMEDDGSDIDELIVIHTTKTKYDMLAAFPDRKKSYEAHLKMLGDPDYSLDMLRGDQSKNADSRADIFITNTAGQKYDALQGYLFVSDRLHVVHKKQRVWVNEKTFDKKIIPQEWDEIRKNEWLQKNPDFKVTMDDNYAVLYLTTIDHSGFVWQNGDHWFQENIDGRQILPGIPLIPSLVDNIPTGLIEDGIPYAIAIATSATEGLNEVRKGSSETTFVPEGSLVTPEALGEELTKDRGVVFMKQGRKPSENIETIQRRPNDIFLQFEDRMQEKLNKVDGANDAIMGVSMARQSLKAKDREISQSLGTQSVFVDSYNRFTLNLTQVMTRLMPYALTEYQIIEIQDEFGKKNKPVEVNVSEWSADGTEAKVVVNDLTACKYRVIPIVADDSATNKEREYKDFIELLEATGNQLFQLSPRFIANIFSQLPNMYARQAAQGLQDLAKEQEQQQQAAAQAEQQTEVGKANAKAMTDMEKMRRPKFSVRVQPSDYQDYPEGFRLMMEAMGKMNYESQQAQQGMQAQPSEQSQQVAVGA
jgi:hypothetical protein